MAQYIYIAWQFLLKKDHVKNEKIDTYSKILTDRTLRCTSWHLSHHLGKKHFSRPTYGKTPTTEKNLVVTET